MNLELYKGSGIVKRYIFNPVLTKYDVPYEVSTVYNPAITMYQNKYILIFRAAKLNGRSILGKAISEDGLNFEVEREPFMVPESDGYFGRYESAGIEDPRITRIGDEYFITYSAYSEYGVRIGLAKTTDFKRVERIALITSADHRNIVIFPEKFGTDYVRLDRPHSDIIPWSIWISYSKDLIHWGRSEILIKPKPYHWDELKIGPGAPPIKTKDGWLSIIHGVYMTMSGSVYRLGVVLHDLEDPGKILGLSDEWILEPEDHWERVGYVPNVVFCSAALKEGDFIRLWWGAADSVVCTGIARVDELVEKCLKNKRKPL
ncbi:MAG TPA: glycosidase [Thermodesulfobium narugense]|uniref:Putative glycosyl hydrolase, GH43/DUF377 family n=1 Tax=Thermodesulfobium acidiphilum TaxID=1794699 RepID=A0A2R4VYL7_THEAF|nr:glycoside hydrolase family 130 protein [Thermodesulfobium acidiphilum]AWB09627.1 putative glycosyl hydrolase, GH43/DUF377 family [Thermodesulfobium acidiphilum]PMP85545.1 MAG: glycosidase [Thermodesulfobium narugense]HEM56547.1 glycosidase [Thermodesulfobium narugense]